MNIIGMGLVIFLMFSVIFGIIVYVVCALAVYRILKILRYPNPWMAWIPFANIFALGHVTADVNGNTKFFGTEIPTMVFSFWFVLQFIVPYIPVIGKILSIAVNVVFLGTIFTYIYAKVEGRPEEDMRALGYVSGLIPIIAIVKFFMYKEN